MKGDANEKETENKSYPCQIDREEEGVRQEHGATRKIEGFLSFVSYIVDDKHHAETKPMAASTGDSTQ